MKNVIAIAISLLFACPVFAQTATKEESEQAKEIGALATKVEDQFQAQQGYINDLEKKLTALSESVNKKLNALSSSVDAAFVKQGKINKEVERRLSGVQEQVNVLHAKKADKVSK